MNESRRQAMAATLHDMLQEEQAWKARNPEPVLCAWPFQEIIDLLKASSFVQHDDATTDMWKRQAWRDGKASYYACYRWTPEGKARCFRCACSTPMR